MSIDDGHRHLAEALTKTQARLRIAVEALERISVSSLSANVVAKEALKKLELL